MPVTKKLFLQLSVIVFSMLGVLSHASHNESHVRQCLNNAQRTYFVTVDRALTTLVQRKRDCRQHITTVDNHLRCLNRATAQYEEAIKNAKRRYHLARWRCNGSRKLIRKDILIYKPGKIKGVKIR